MNQLNSARFRRSLGHFAIGKLINSLLGFGLLVLLVRALPRADYGAYIALVAIFEFAQLGSNLGSIPAAFRYVPALFARGESILLQQLVRRLLVLRTVTIIGVASAIYFSASWLSNKLALDNYVPVLEIFALYCIFEGLCRYFEVVFDSLLMQGASQAAALVRGGIRMLGMVCLPFVLVGEWSLARWIWVEVTASALGLILASIWLWVRLFGREVAPPALAGVARTESDGDLWKRIIAYSVPGYAAQLVGLFSSVQVVRLIATSLAGAVGSAAFGFVSVLTMTMQRYLPSFLLIGMIRPLFVAARETGRKAEDLVQLADMVFKLNVLTLAPIWAAFLVCGPELVDLLTAGKYPDALPFVHWFILFVLTQVIRAEVELLGLACEEGRVSFYGSLWALIGVVLGALAVPVFGLAALCIGLIASNIIWCMTMLMRLRLHGLFWLPAGKGEFRLAAALTLVLLIGSAIKTFLPVTGTVAILAYSVCAGMAFLLLAALFKPLTSKERHLAGRVLPPWLVVF